VTVLAAAPPAAGARFEPPTAADGIGRIVVDRPDDAVNALDPALVEALGEAVRAARAHVEAGLRGLVLVSAKPGQWIAGADLKLLTSGADASELEQASRRFQAVCDQLAWLPCTTVAALSGPALGGGFEVALACDYRVAADTDSVLVGQPEVSLGLIPAGGGTQRLPRLVGLAPALDLILSGRRLNRRRARRAGLIDELVHPAVLEAAARRWAAGPKRPLSRPLRLGLSAGAALDLAELTPAGRALLYRQARASIEKRTRGHYPAPLRALEAIQTGFEHGMAAGLDVEARAFAELARTPVAANLIGLFLATQRQRRASGVADKTVEPTPVHQLGVVGAGFMGAGIAEVGAVAGLPVRVRDVQPDAVAHGLAAISRLVDEAVRRGRLTPTEGRAARQRVSGSTTYAGFGRCDLVIEAVFEQLETKRAVVAELEAVLRPDAVIASNTSALPIRELAAQAQHPERIVGMHFFSPAHRMPLLEVVRGPDSADWAIATAVATGNRLGKTVIVVGDGPGFYTSRVLGVMMNEAALLLGEGAAMRAVDRALTAFGFPVGPFVLYDEVGLQVAEHAGRTLAGAFGDRLPPSTIVPRLVAAGATGRKSGRGFYLWPKPSRLRRLARRPGRVPNPEVRRLLGEPPQRAFPATELQDRLVLLFVTEAVRCLEEGVLRSAVDGDLGAVLGLGFPPFRGGPFRYADSLGLPTLVDRLRALAERHGARYAPPSLLVTRAERGAPFYP
jgi:3-hydroxyacyl-CoA dehydrogenase / enoyl-CoA hydratase / 3-hydroxybutyryl-CoA epimerase